MPAWLALILQSFKNGLIAFVARRPRLLRTLVGLARRRAPVLQAFGLTLVTREDDVREVFERDEDFIVSPINERKMFTGDFLFSLDPSPKYLEEKTLSFNAFPGNRIDQLESITDAAANTFLASASGSFDAVRLAERVTVEIAKSFWGLDPAGARSTVVQADSGEDTLGLWVRKLAAVITSEEPAPFGLQEAGIACRDEYLRFVQAACNARRQSGTPPGSDVMGRLVANANPEISSRNIAGHIVTASAVVTKAFAHALEQLLSNADARDRAIDAAARNDRTGLARIVLEALRFNPVFPMLTRYCPRNTTLAPGTPRETAIAAGSTVVASPLGALFDPVAIDNPERFDCGRTLELNPAWITRGTRYGGPANSGRGASLIFSGGTHWCIGDEMALAELAAMAMAVLKLPNPRAAGPLRRDWSAVESLVVEFDR